MSGSWRAISYPSTEPSPAGRQGRGRGFCGGGRGYQLPPRRTGATSLKNSVVTFLHDCTRMVFVTYQDLFLSTSTASGLPAPHQKHTSCRQPQHAHTQPFWHGVPLRCVHYLQSWRVLLMGLERLSGKDMARHVPVSELGVVLIVSGALRIHGMRTWAVPLLLNVLVSLNADDVIMGFLPFDLKSIVFVASHMKDEHEASSTAHLATGREGRPRTKAGLSAR